MCELLTKVKKALTWDDGGKSPQAMETHMRSASLRSLFLALAAATLASAPVLAGGLHDHVYADSFGNLIVHSPAGYKRIIVGEGHMADQLSGYTDADGPDVVYL